MRQRPYKRAFLNSDDKTVGDYPKGAGEQPESLLGLGRAAGGSCAVGNTIRFRYRNREITIDRHGIPVWRNYISTTRVRIHYVARDGFIFTLRPKTIFSGLSKILLPFRKAISVGYGLARRRLGKPAHSAVEVIEGEALSLSKRLTVKSNDALKARSLFGNSKLRELVGSQSPVFLENYRCSGHGEGSSGRVNILSVSVAGTITDWRRLRPLCELASYTLDSLCSIGSAFEGSPPPSI